MFCYAGLCKLQDGLVRVAIPHGSGGVLSAFSTKSLQGGVAPASRERKRFNPTIMAKWREIQANMSNGGVLIGVIAMDLETIVCDEALMNLIWR